MFYSPLYNTLNVKVPVCAVAKPSKYQYNFIRVINTYILILFRNPPLTVKENIDVYFFTCIVTPFIPKG